MQRDTEIFNLIQKERERQTKGIELIASENFVSDQVMEAMGSVMTNKYAEGYPGKRYYGGCQVVDQSETIAIERAKKLYGACWANVQPHSGAQANMAVFLACLNSGDTFMGMDLNHGGHLSHGSPVNFSGINYKVVGYQVKEETGMVDYEDMEKKALEHHPKLIIGGGSAYSRDWDWARMREIADKIGAILMGDISHPSGLIAKGYLNNAIKYCHIVTTTKKMSALLDSAVFPGTQGGPLEHVIAAKAVAFGEALTDSYDQYIQQVMKNAKVMCEAFVNKGYKVISGGTDNHLMLIDLRTKFPELTGKEAENALVAADITVNKNMVPFDSRSAFKTSGLRVGTPAITTRGLKEADMPVIVDMIDTVLCNPTDEAVRAKITGQVNEMMQNRPLFAW